MTHATTCKDGTNPLPETLSHGLSKTRLSTSYTLPRFTILGDGWRPHYGGECPVPPETVVEVQLRNGFMCVGRALTNDHCMSQSQWIENRDFPKLTIVAYRRVTITPAADPLAAVKAAHAAGRTVQYWSKALLEWMDQSAPNFSPAFMWRAKPEPCYVAWVIRIGTACFETTRSATAACAAPRSPNDMNTNTKLGLQIIPHPTALQTEILRFSWKDHRGTLHAVEASILLDWNEHAMAKFLRDFSNGILFHAKGPQ